MKTIAKVITVMAVVTAVFAGSQRTSNLGGTQYWADDWDYVTIFPQAINDHTNLAWYDGSDFTAYCGGGDKVWGLTLSGDEANNLIDLNVGLNNGLGVAFSMNMDDDDATDDAWALSAGKNLDFGNVAFNYDSDGNMGVVLARAQSVLWWDNMFVGFAMLAEVDSIPSEMVLGADLFKNSDGSLFALSIVYSDAGDGSLSTIWTFAREAQLFDWATLRVGYSKGCDLVGLAGTVGAFTSGVGMTWGQWGLDVTINDLTAITGNPLHYATGRNTNAVFSSLDLYYRW